MVNLWYVARHGEILVDMDKPNTSLPHMEMRLRGAIKTGMLAVERVEVHRSFNESHLHMLITLDRNSQLSAYQRAVWSLMFHSDIYRACNTFMRILHNIGAPDLLITPVRFNREPDAECDCDTKHDGATMQVCPAAISLRGDDRIRSYFGKPVRAERAGFPQDFKVYNSNWTIPGYVFNETESEF